MDKKYLSVSGSHVQAESVWGDKIIDTISKDIRAEFPRLQGFSRSNIYNMKKFYLFYKYNNEIVHQPGGQIEDMPQNKKSKSLAVTKKSVIVQQPVGQLSTLFTSVPWGHHVEIFTHCKDITEALFYIQKTIENGWSRAVLMNFIESGLYKRQGKALNNFRRLLPDIQSDLAQETIKDPYNFDFLTLTEGYKERELEDALTGNLARFLLELGKGFAYIGRQIQISVGDDDFFIDLLFYNLELRCYVVIELKAGKFEPEHTGKLGLYVAAVNHQFKKHDDNPTIGLLICKTKNNIVAQYSLESVNQPIGISEYHLSRLLPKNYKSKLPSIKEIEKELSERMKKGKK